MVVTLVTLSLRKQRQEDQEFKKKKSPLATKMSSKSSQIPQNLLSQKKMRKRKVGERESGILGDSLVGNSVSC